jgi:1,4-dihydroxy-2-naphthoate octaprenyltransferase
VCSSSGTFIDSDYCREQLTDRHTDLKANKQTLAVRFGAMFCKVEYTFLLLAAYGVAMHQSLLSSSLASLPLLTIHSRLPNCVKAMRIKEGRDFEVGSVVGKTAFVELLYCVFAEHRYISC